MKQIRIGVTGGRHYSDKKHVYTVLDLHKRALDCLGLEMVLVVGDATGVDWIARIWASTAGVALAPEGDPEYGFIADWNQFGKAAGPLRNLKMINSGIDKLCAFPGGSGTKHMVENCERNGIKVVEYKP